MIPWLEQDTPFPPPDQALEEPNGLLCAGGDLSPSRILEAYRSGIFPWFSRGDPILWWTPSPRMVLIPREFKISRSLRKTLRAGHYEVSLDKDFAAVIAACAQTPRKGQPGTWIGTAMQHAYCTLHELGWAHSVETWVNGQLAGGLYGIAIGRMFYGESMFTRQTDASKIALAHLARFLDSKGYGMVDCQMYTDHLASLGAREIPRQAFMDRLLTLVNMEPAPARWPVEAARTACTDW